MNINDLRKIILEDVTKAVTTVLRSELRDFLLELTEDQRQVATTSKPSRLSVKTQGRSISDILQETAETMGREEYRDLMGDRELPNFQTTSVLEEKKRSLGDMPDFIAAAASKAKKVLDISDQKDKERHGL